MSDVVRSILYILLIFLEFVLNVVFKLSDNVFYVIGQLFHIVFNAIMMETSEKRRQSRDKPNSTVSIRSMISPNWQKFLSSNLINDKKTEKLVDGVKDNHYTGTFRRTRKNKANQQNSFETNLKTLDLNNTSKKTNKIPVELNDMSDGVVRTNNRSKLTKFIAIDCEMVGIGYDGNDHMLARVSLVNKFGDCVYDKFVKAREEVVDYRTDISGIRREDMLNGEDFTVVQKEVSDIIKGRVLVGHSLKNDLSVLFLSHPKRNIRDTAKYKPFRKIAKGSTPSLKRLAKEVLGVDIQHGEHSSVEDARAVMKLYCSVGKKWEATLCDKRGYDRKILAE